MESRAEFHARQLSWLQQSWSSIDIRVLGRITASGRAEGRPQDADRVDYHYIETAAGQRMLDSRYSMLEVERYRSTEFFDGRRGISIAYRGDDTATQQQAIIHRHFAGEDRVSQTSRPQPFLYDWVDRRPLCEAIQDGQLMSEGSVIGRPCDVFLFPASGWSGKQDHVYWLDRDTSVPLKVQFFADPQARLANRPVLVWSAEELSEFQGFPFVVKSSQSDHAGEDGTLNVTVEYRVVSVDYNRDFPVSMFQPEIQPEAIVYDTIANRPPRRSSESSHGQIPGVALEATATTTIRADPPHPWGTHASAVFFGLGVASVVAGLIVRWRRTP